MDSDFELLIIAKKMDFMHLPERKVTLKPWREPASLIFTKLSNVSERKVIIMPCYCNTKDFLEGNAAVIFAEKYLSVIKVDAVNWKTLYKCNDCDLYWEEIYRDGRFGGTPELRKVTVKYIQTEWGV